MRKPKPKRLKISLRIQIEGEEGMQDFARVLRLLHANGYEANVRKLVLLLIAAAKKHGAAVPVDLEEFANGE